jgi:uncharacterized protein (TIGR02246 family)
MKIAMTVVLLCGLAAPALADDDAEVRALAEEFKRSWDRGDLKGALALYDRDARVVWPGQGDEARGTAAVEALLARTFKMFPKSGLTLKSQDVIRLGGNYLGNVGMWEQTVTGPDGTPATHVVRTTEILRREGRGLVYVVDHASIGLPPPPAASAPTAPASPAAR